MRWSRKIRFAVRSLVRRQRNETELEAELQSHIDMQTEQFVRDGVDPEEARRRARMTLGGAEQIKETVREGWFGVRIESAWRDARYGVRMLARNPGFTIVAVLTLGLGIGATTAIFSLVNGALIRPLPFPEPQRLAMIRVDLPDQDGYPGLTKAELREFQTHSERFEALGAAVGYTLSLTAEGSMEQVDAATVTDELFPLLGVSPAMGRIFGDEDHFTERGSFPSVIVSHDLWQRRYGGRPDILGAGIEINNVSRTIVGVMSRGFRLPMGPGTYVASNVDVWVPAVKNDDFLHVHAWRTVARLAAGSSFSDAEHELESLGQRVVEKYPEAFENEKVSFHAHPLHGDLVQESRPALLALMAAVGFLLLIACANVANLMLGHTERRRKEIAIRVTLGAGRGKILRQLLIENALLAVLGGAVGVLVAHWGLGALVSRMPDHLRIHEGVALDGFVLAFTSVVALLTSLVFGWFPAWQTCRLDPNEVVKEGGRDSGRGAGRGVMRNALVVAEVGISLILLVGAGLMGRTLVELLRVDLGFEPTGVLTLRAPVNTESFDTPEKRWEFFRRTLRRVSAVPGVESVGGIRRMPLVGDQFSASFAYDDQTAATFGTRSATYDWVLPGYFRSMGIALRSGRTFTEGDNDSAPLEIVIDETLAGLAWPGDVAVGRRLLVDANFGSDDRQWAEVIGVVGNVRSEDPRRAGGPQIYFPYNNLVRGGTDMVLTVRTSGDPAALAGAVRREVEAQGGGRPVHTVRLAREITAEARAGSSFVLFLMGAFAVSALSMSMIGTYGVIRYSVAQRTHEIGIRSALGARGGDIVRLVLGEGLSMICIGLVIGLVGAVGVTRVLQQMLYGVSATDPMTFVLVTLTLIASGLAACYLPARRAARVDPVEAIRCD